MKGRKGIAPLLLYGGLIAVVAVIVLVIVSQIQIASALRNQGAPVHEEDLPDREEQEQVTACPEGKARNAEGDCVSLKGPDTQTPCPGTQVRTNTGVCVELQCAQGQIRNEQGQCVFSQTSADPELKQCEPRVRIRDGFAYHKKRVGDSSNVQRGAPVSMEVEILSDCEANYYFEAGLMQASGLTILVQESSACDGNPHFAGRWIKGSKNTKFNSNRPAGVVSIAFFPQDYGKAEKLRMVGGVYTGCAKDGGKPLAEIPPQVIELRNAYTDTEITNSVTKII